MELPRVKQFVVVVVYLAPLAFFATAKPAVAQMYNIEDYGARSVYAPASSTCTISTSSYSMTLGGAGNWLNGDWVACYGAGATNTMSTPSAPTVTPVTAKGLLGSGVVVTETGQSTSYTYKVVYFDAGDGATAASAGTTITTGDASLGAKGPLSISSISKSGTLATITLASPNTELSAGTLISIGGTTPGDMSGWFLVNSVIDSTHITVVQTDSTAYGAPTSGTGGSIDFYVGNHISWSHVSGVSFGCVYETSPVARFVGCSRPDGVINEDYVTDYGSAMMGTVGSTITLPPWIPSSPPSSATNDVLVMRITAGGGTTSLTVATAAGNSVTAGPAMWDDSVAFSNAATAAGSAPGGGAVFIPAGSFNISAPLNLNTVFVRQQGALYLYNTLTLSGASKWESLVDSSSTVAQFAFNGGTVIAVEQEGIPGIIFNQNEGGYYSGMVVGGRNDSQDLLAIADNCAQTHWVHDSFSTGSTNDFMGLGFVERDNDGFFDDVFDEDSFLGAQISTWTPEFLATGTQFAEYMKNIQFSGKEMYFAGVALPLTIEYSHSQGPQQPLVSGNLGLVQLDWPTMDTGNTIVAANLEGQEGGQLTLRGNTSAGSGIVSGAPFGVIYNFNWENNPPGQNFNLSGDFTPGYEQIGSLFSAYPINGIVDYQISPRIGGPKSVFSFQSLYPAVTASAATGSGGFALGAGTVQVAPVYASGNSGAASATVPVTFTSGNTALTASLANAIPGAVSYTWYVDGLPANPCVEITSLTCNAAGSYGGGAFAPGVSADGDPHVGPDGINTAQGIMATPPLAVLSGCSFTNELGGTWSGAFTSGTTGTCTVTITFQRTALNGWYCPPANDLTTATDQLKQTAYTTTTATISGTTVSGDLVTWGCTAF